MLLNTQQIERSTDWLMAMYVPDEGLFEYRGKPVSKYSVKKHGVGANVMKYRAYHLIESDWLTYYLTRISRNSLEKG